MPILKRKRGLAILRFPQIDQQELIRYRRRKFMFFDINTTDPVAFLLEFFDEACPERSRRMSTDETTGTTD
ncbi:MAG: hypothetical protein KAW49_16970 [Anaerolineae bacterium]|nr:hypothetical protein [Anaerolineae bacterium]